MSAKTEPCPLCAAGIPVVERWIGTSHASGGRVRVFTARDGMLAAICRKLQARDRQKGLRLLAGWKRKLPPALSTTPFRKVRVYRPAFLLERRKQMRYGQEMLSLSKEGAQWLDYDLLRT